MPETPHQPPAAAVDQDASMDTILASIRRIIMEDEAVAPPPAHDEPDDELLVLQPSMIVEQETRGNADMAELLPPHQNGGQSAADLAAALFDMPETVAAPPPAIASPVLVPVPAAEPAAPPPVAVVMPVPVAPPAPVPVADRPEFLLAPAASLAAAQSLASLQEAIRPEPEAPAGLRLLRSGGPTLEDMVREELRGQLKQWLDANLPPLVERLVAQEISRLAGRG